MKRVFETWRQVAAMAGCGMQGVFLLRALLPTLSTHRYWGGSAMVEAGILVVMAGGSVALGFVGMRARDRVFRWMGLFAVMGPWVLVAMVGAMWWIRG